MSTQDNAIVKQCVIRKPLHSLIFICLFLISIHDIAKKFKSNAMEARRPKNSAIGTKCFLLLVAIIPIECFDLVFRKTTKTKVLVVG